MMVLLKAVFSSVLKLMVSMSILRGAGLLYTTLYLMVIGIISYATIPAGVFFLYHFVGVLFEKTVIISVAVVTFVFLGKLLSVSSRIEKRIDLIRSLNHRFNSRYVSYSEESVYSILDNDALGEWIDNKAVVGYLRNFEKVNNDCALSKGKEIYNLQKRWLALYKEQCSLRNKKSKLERIKKTLLDEEPESDIRDMQESRIFGELESIKYRKTTVQESMRSIEDEVKSIRDDLDRIKRNEEINKILD